MVLNYKLRDIHREILAKRPFIAAWNFCVPHHVKMRKSSVTAIPGNINQHSRQCITSITFISNVTFFLKKKKPSISIIQFYERLNNFQSATFSSLVFLPYKSAASDNDVPAKHIEPRLTHS